MPGSGAEYLLLFRRVDRLEPDLDASAAAYLRPADGQGERIAIVDADHLSLDRVCESEGSE
jgi:hypothetical protein